MAYKIELNNKTYTTINAIPPINGQGGILTFNLIDNDDIWFFKKWVDKKNICNKKDYIKNIKYTKVTNSGVLYNCICRINDNETEVYISYDYKIND